MTQLQAFRATLANTSQKTRYAFAVWAAFTGIRAVRRDKCVASKAQEYPSKGSAKRSDDQEAACRDQDHDSPCQVSPPGWTVGHERNSQIQTSHSLSASGSESQRVCSVCRRVEGRRDAARDRGKKKGRVTRHQALGRAATEAESRSKVQRVAGLSLRCAIKWVKTQHHRQLSVCLCLHLSHGGDINYCLLLLLFGLIMGDSLQQPVRTALLQVNRTK